MKKTEHIKYQIKGNPRIFNESITDASLHLSYLKVDKFKNGKLLEKSDIVKNRRLLDVKMIIEKNKNLTLITK